MKRSRFHCECSLRYSINAYIEEIDIPSRKKISPVLYKLFLKEFSKVNEKYSLSRIKKHEGIFHPTYYASYYLDDLSKNKLVVTVHDMIHEKFPQYFKRNDETSVHKLKVVKRADRIIAVSQHTKNDLVELLGVEDDRISVIYHGIDCGGGESLKRNEQFPRRYVLYVGERGGYKNFGRFLEAFALLSLYDASLELVCTGKPFNPEELRVFKQYGLLRKIHHEAASEYALRQLYAQALVFVYPSEYEGFGIPILEAFREKCPVALSRSSCFPEVAADAACFFDAGSVEDISATVHALISDAALRTEKIALGEKRAQRFSWENTVSETAAVYRSLR